MTERQYKDSGIDWIGDIPNDWDVKRIKYAVVEMGSGTTPSSDNSHFYGGDIPWIQSGDLYNTPLITKTSKTVTEQAFQSCSALKIFHKPYIVIAMYGASVGNVSMSLIDACTNQACCVIKPNANNNLAYLKYWLEICKTDFINKSVGGGQPNISQDKIREQAYICPSLEEQQQIADFLDSKTASIDSAIQAQKDIVEKLKEYRQSVITEAVTKGLNRDAEMKESKTNGVDKIPATWEDMKIKYLGSFCNGLTYHPEDICGEDEGTLVLRSSNIQNGKLNFNDNVYVKCSIPTKIRVKKGDIIICSRNGSAKLIGKNALVTNDMNATFGAFMMMFRCDSPRYMYYVLNSKTWETYLSLFATTTINQLTSTTFGNLLFPYTFDKEEQCRIVEYLDSKTATIDKAIEQKNAIIEKLEEYKKSIIYNAVTGKIDCRKDVIPE